MGELDGGEQTRRKIEQLKRGEERNKDRRA